MHRETEKAHFTEIIAPEGLPLKGRQRELRQKVQKWKWFIFCKAQPTQPITRSLNILYRQLARVL